MTEPIKLPPLPEPEAYLYFNGEHKGVSLNYRGDSDLASGTIRHALVTYEQAEAYARAAIEAALQSQVMEDAERYRWIRDPCSGADRVILYSRGDYGKGLISGEMLDEAIDHARRIEDKT